MHETTHIKHTHTNIHTYVYIACMHTYIDTYTHTHTHIHTYMHTHTHTYIHAYTHTHIHTCHIKFKNNIRTPLNAYGIQNTKDYTITQIRYHCANLHDN